MKILTERDAFLSNYEVQQHLESMKNKYHWTFSPGDNAKDAKLAKRKDKKHYTACGINLEVVTRDVLACLDNSESGVIETLDQFKELMGFLNGLELMKIEKLQIVNSLPRSLVVLYAIVEECEERFGEEVSEGIIGKINELFPIEQEEEGEGEEDAEMEE
ncbi:DNA-directed RNA polymerase III subunit RPC9 [Candida viswanathii]|uniref:DNA-directed RNA polymerase III subunit RPC9 n=1 Tax=Candida viswanathii TaxID=5486 RepID=A0A367YGX1_9ASCO|nr:DNA-directed RNA polymerase III subunit RPC9 [Candida viswanathii]